MTTAKEQAEMVNNRAKLLLLGQSFDSMIYGYHYDKDIGESLMGKHVKNFSMKNVEVRFSEIIPDGLIKDVYAGDLGAITKLQSVIWQAAKEIAFQSLDLESAPYADLEVLEAYAEEENTQEFYFKHYGISPRSYADEI